jgi:hypothetical protein
VIDASTWAFSAFQVTAHLRLMAPMIERHRPWLQVGGGLYRVNRNLAEPNSEGVYAYIVGGPGNIAVVPGWNTTAGLDLRVSPHTVIGLDANYHYLWSEHEDIPEFSAFAVGMHILFGR